MRMRLNSKKKKMLTLMLVTALAFSVSYLPHATSEEEEPKTSKNLFDDLCMVRYSLEGRDDNKFACRQRSTITQDYLKRKGYKMEYCEGTHDGNPHAWLRVQCKDADTGEIKWYIVESHFVDPPGLKIRIEGKEEELKDHYKAEKTWADSPYLYEYHYPETPYRGYLIWEEDEKPVLTREDETKTKTGTTYVYSNSGFITEFEPMGVPKDVPENVKLFPHGLLRFKIESLSPGGKVEIEIVLPVPEGHEDDSQYSPEKWEYWKYYEGKDWFKVEKTTKAEFCKKDVEWCVRETYDKPKRYLIALKLTDGKRGDWDTKQNGEIVDPGGPAYVELPVGGISVPMVVPFDKPATLLAPYIGLASTILVTTVVTAIYFKRIKHRKEKQ